MNNIIYNNLFGYEGMKIAQRKDMLNFSLDSVIVSHKVTIPKNVVKIADIGTGNGAIALFLANRTKAQIKGFEIQKDVAELARISVVINNLQDQIEIIEEDIINVDKSMYNSFDVIVSNPPYFKIHPESKFNDSDYKTIARHELHLNFEELVKISYKLLKSNGYFTFVHRPDRIQELVMLLTQNKFAIKRIVFIHPKVGQVANSVIVESIKDGNFDGTIIETPIIAHNEDGSYSDVVQSMFLREEGEING